MNAPTSSRVGRAFAAGFLLISACASLLAQAPTITGFAPNPIGIGVPVTISGTNFSGNGNVTVRFANVTATSTVITSNNTVVATTPQNLNPGAITVSTAAGTATSAPYDITLQPVITSIAPASGPELRVVTLNGYNFIGTGIANRTVRLNGVLVGNTSTSTNTISFPIPIGATSGPITVQTSGGLATSLGNLTVETGPPPPNDNYAAATVIGGSNGSFSGNNANATSEPGEPAHPGNAGGRSVWFAWTAPSTGTFLFNPTDNVQFGIVQAIYTGANLSSLSLVASGLTPTSVFARYSSAAALSAIAGTTYYIALDGYTGLMANYRLAWSPLGPPTISGFTPAAHVGQQVSINGSNFPPGCTVSIGGTVIPPSRINYNSATSIIIPQLPANVTSGPVVITTPAGTITSTNFTVTPAPAPSNIVFSPASGTPGSPVTITGNAVYLGSDLPASIVRFNGTPSITVIGQNTTTLNVIVPPGATTGPISVETARGLGVSAGSFTVINPTPPPVISTFGPEIAAVGANITITGQNFSNVTAVTFNGVSSNYTVSSSSLLTATVPNGATTGPITVASTAGSGVSSTPFVVPPVPTITSFTPAALSWRTRVVITGTGFANASAVSFNGLGTSFTIDSDTQITTQAPPNATPGPITVTTPYGTAFSPAHYTLLPHAAPSIASFSPPTVYPGLPVIIDGNGFSGVAEVRFNNVSTTFAVLSPTQIETRAPTNATPGLITVSTTLGTATSASPYAVTLAPIITGFTPSSGPNGRVITVTGANFLGTGISGQVVRVNGVSIGSSSRSTNTYQFAIPAAATTGPITIQTSQGSATSPTNFIIEPGPAPANDHFANATSIGGPNGTLFGNTANATKEPGEPSHANNPGGASVWFKWVAPSSGYFLFDPYNSSTGYFGIIQSIYVGDSVSSLTRVATGATPTSILTRYGSAAVLNAVAGTTYRIALDGYNGAMSDYRLTWSPFGPPTISSFNPASGTAGSNTTVSISGSNFASGGSVLFGNVVVPSSQVTYTSRTQISVSQIPATAVTAPITVTTPAGSATSTGNFTIGAPVPVITGFSPGGARVGSPVNISGANFVGTSAILFNGTAAGNFTVTGNNTLISTFVPTGATTGPITVVTANGPATTTQPFVVMVPPVIIEQPQSQTAFVGGNVTFSILAQSNGPEEYQWSKNGTPIPNNPSALTRNLVLYNVTTADNGLYTCLVANNAGNEVSQPATLTVVPRPADVALGELTQTYDGAPKPVSVTTMPGGLATFVTYNGSPAAPTNAGNYEVSAVIADSGYAGAITGTLTILKAIGTVTLSNLSATYDGTPKTATATTSPAGLAVALTYNGSASAPADAGSYAVAATITDANHVGGANGTLVIAPAPASIQFAGLAQRYNGTPRIVTATTTPENLPVTLTYAGSPTAPVLPGSYAVNAVVNDANHVGSSNATLHVSITALVRRAPLFNADLEGSAQVLTGESVTLNSNALVAGDLLVPGTPDVRLNGHPTFGSTVDATGATTPANYVVTLNGNSVLGRVVRRVDPVALPVVAAPQSPTGTRDVALNSPEDSAGDFATVRNLTLNRNAGMVALPPGAYGSISVNDDNVLVLGSAGATEPSAYDLQQLTLGSRSRIEIAGPVVLTLGSSLNANGTIGDAASASRLTLRIASGGLTLNGSARLAGHVVAPNGTVTLNSATLIGLVIADGLVLNGAALLADPVE